MQSHPRPRADTFIAHHDRGDYAPAPPLVPSLPAAQAGCTHCVWCGASWAARLGITIPRSQPFTLLAHIHREGSPHPLHTLARSPARAHTICRVLGPHARTKLGGAGMPRPSSPTCSQSTTNALRHRYSLCFSSSSSLCTSKVIPQKSFLRSHSSEEVPH